MVSIGNSVRHHAILRPDAVALVEDDRHVTYAMLDQLVSGCALRLVTDGVRVGDRVAIVLPNSIEWVIAYQGALRAGAVPVPLNPLLADAEINAIVRDSEPAAVISCDRWSRADQHPACSLVYDIAAAGKPLVSTTAAAVECPPCRPDDTAVILYSSGSTGQPKGVELTHYNMFWNAQAFALDLLRLTPEDRGYGVLPLSHVFGHTCLHTTFLLVGASISLSARFDPEDTLRAIDRDRVTVFMGVPTMYWMLAKAPLPDGLDLSCWRGCVSGGQALPEEVHARFEERFSVPISEGYGMTEASPSICGARLFGAIRKSGSSGQPYWGVKLRIVDEHGCDLPTGEKGEIVVSSPGLAKGYFRRPDLTDAAFRDGWLHTGDIGMMDEDGFLFVVDRKKEMIISGGYNVYPREIEELGHRMPGVLEVAAIGQPHEKLGEKIVAYIVAEPGIEIDAESLIAQWGASLARYKVPREVRILESLPRNATGKVDRMRLRAMNSEY
tara:strand:+ start:16091 stop:17581 length:1491 start_codon:yes stop_codon:yes gene_type:complete